MQQMVRTFGQRLSEILFVKRLHIGAFMRETKGHLVVKSPQDISARLGALLTVVNRLTAAARAAAGAGHDLNEVILHVAGGNRLHELPGVAESTDHRRADRACTGNVETVVLLSKGEIDSKKVRVEFSLEDMDMSGFQKGATYEQIKAYVLEHTGLKVSSLYISQIKRKCGLDVGQNYNLSKKEDAKVPKCPPEKEAAIRDALKYFQMI